MTVNRKLSIRKLSIEIEDDKLYSLSGQIVLDRTWINLRNIIVQYRKVTTYEPHDENAVKVKIQDEYHNFDILKFKDNVDKINDEIERMGRSVAPHLKGFLWHELNGQISYDIKECKYDFTSDGILTIYAEEDIVLKLGTAY
jgi:hypothetical protein